MAQSIQAVRGMNDFLPPETYLWQHVEDAIRQTIQSFGYHEIRFPIVEKTELFKRSIGEATDIVEKEMYTFLDRNQESLTLRPEGTASCVRACLEHGILHNQTRKLWYGGPYFRHERPQKGRYRQFHQIGAEVFGLAGPDIDAELIVLSAHIFERLNIRDHLKLQINTLGTKVARDAYRQVLVAYFRDHQHELDEDSLRRLERNPLRILDSKNPAMQSLILGAPKLMDHLDDGSKQHFEMLQALLKGANIPFEVNPCLVRGLDYYTNTVFEWVTTDLGAQGTLCAGGRYDQLVEQLGGRPTPALGFAIGMERTVLLLKETQNVPTEPYYHGYIITDGDAAFAQGLKMAEHLRKAIPALRLLQHCGGGSLKNQFKKADKSQAAYAVIIGEDELKTGQVSVKNLRQDVPQQSLHLDELTTFFRNKIESLP